MGEDASRTVADEACIGAAAVVGAAGRGASGIASTSTAVRPDVLLFATILDEKSEPDFGFSVVVSISKSRGTDRDG